jgi:hypothetical protein
MIFFLPLISIISIASVCAFVENIQQKHSKKVVKILFNTVF